MLSLNNFLPLILLLLRTSQTTAEWNTQDYLRREYSLIPPYSQESYDFGGSTIVTNKYVRLTPDLQSKQGSIWTKQKIYLREWEIHVDFKVHGRGTDLFGDGFAIWFTRDKLVGGPVFGNQDFFSGLGVFLDTYANQNGPHNHNHPYISAMISNGSLHYDHDRDGTHTELDGCEAQFRNSVHETHVAIRFSRNTLTVSTDINGERDWKPCFTVTGIALPTGYYFGASAATGELSDTHDIVSMKVYELDFEPDPTDKTDYTEILPFAESHAPHRDHVDDLPVPSRFWTVFTYLFYGILLLAAVGTVGYLVFQNQYDSSRKRFY